MCHILTTGVKSKVSSDGEDGLTPRQEPQGEESKLAESSSPKPPSANNSQFLRYSQWLPLPAARELIEPIELTEHKLPLFVVIIITIIILILYS